MSPIPKHLRPRWRYLAVAICTWTDRDLDRTSFEAAVQEAVRSLHGDIGCADADLRLFRFTYHVGRGQAVIRVRRDAVDVVRSALTCMDSINDTPVGLQIVGVSGTVRACEEKFLGSQGEAIEQRTVAFDGVEYSATVVGVEVDLQSDDGRIGAISLDLE